MNDIDENTLYIKRGENYFPIEGVAILKKDEIYCPNCITGITKSNNSLHNIVEPILKRKKILLGQLKCEQCKKVVI